jgi:hypothetical protein
MQFPESIYHLFISFANNSEGSDAEKSREKRVPNLDNKNMKVSVNGGKQTSALQYLSVKNPQRPQVGTSKRK